MDTRALDPEVFQAAAAAVRERAAAGGTFRALEVGAGAGNAFPRWMRLLGPVRRLSFTATDAHADLLAAYRREVVRWARAGGLELRPAARGGLLLKGRLRSGAPGDPDARTGPTERTLEVRFARARVPAGLRDRPPGHLDLLLAQSFWDLAPRGTPLRLARELLAPGGVFYAALTFSGVTRFHPALKEDREVLAAYHASMEVPGRGDSRAGARLVAEARERASGLAELASGRSDWRVEPSPEGG